MRLLNVHTLQFSQYFFDNPPCYVIASHRWTQDETTFEELEKDGTERNTSTAGYQKVLGFAEFVKVHVPHIEWIWVDTCCINKKDASELSEAIRSMFRWYREAEVCLAYLVDVETAVDISEFKRSQWFRRGWTLQELLAPQTVIFLTKAWKVIGHKGGSERSIGMVDLDLGPSLSAAIVSASRIPQTVLDDFETGRDFTVEERLSWMDDRETTRKEDMTYSLLGIFDVSMPVLYGEGAEKARNRFLSEIHRASESTNQVIHEPPQKILDWLSAPDPWTNHASARHRHETGTGLWLLRSERYQKWKHGFTDSRHFWLSGKAGSGKTIICSSVVEDVQTYCKGTAGTEYAAFYFSFSDLRKQSYENLLRSLVAQLVVKSGLLKLRQAYEKLMGNPPSVLKLVEILYLSIESYTTVFILLDALDECPDSSVDDGRQSILQFLEELTQNTPNVKIFVTSRPLLDVSTSMDRIHAAQEVARGQPVAKDIEKYISTQLSYAPRLSRLKPELRVLIADTLSQKADGMFRWAFCQIEELKKLKLTRPSDIKKALSALPKSLDKTYERMLVAIDTYRDEALVLLKWLAYAQSPLSLAELTETMVIDLQEGIVDVENRGSLEDVLELLVGLITIEEIENIDNIEDEFCSSSLKAYASSDSSEDESYKACLGDDGGDHSLDKIGYYENADGHRSTRLNRVQQSLENEALYRRSIRSETRVRLAHYSVKEYLESERILNSRVKHFYLNAAVGHKLLAQSCLIYMMHYSGSSEKTSTTEDQRKFPILFYAATKWFVHSALQEASEVSLEMALLCSDVAKRDWLLVHDPHGRSSLSIVHQPEIKIETALYYASLLGLAMVVKELLSSGWSANLHAQGGELGNALIAASARNHEKVVKMLIDHGADVNISVAGWFKSALNMACMGGHEKIAKMLIDNGADIKAQRTGPSVLRTAIMGGYEKIVEMLIDNGACVNTQRAEDAPLKLASAVGHEKMVKMLIESGADVNNVREEGSGGNALEEASSHGHNNVVTMLIKAGADVGAQGGSALLAASREGHVEIVKMLIEAGIDVNARPQADLYYDSALYLASEGGHVEVVQMLIEAGADVGAQEGSALLAALRGGHVEIVKMLIEAGTDVGALGRSALHIASRGGHVEIVKMLIEAGADVGALGRSALLAASRGGYVEIVKMLIEAGIDVNARLQFDLYYDSALHLALGGGHVEVVQMLIEAGADIGAQEGSALRIASRGGYIKIVKMLIEAGADVGAQEGSALLAASREGHTEIVKMLIEAGIDVNARLWSGLYYDSALHLALDGGHVEVGRSALLTASRGGYVEIVKMLIEAGIDVNAGPQADLYYDSALYLASEGGHVEVVQMLIEAGADVGAQEGSALLAASRGGRVEIAKMLLKTGAEVDT